MAHHLEFYLLFTSPSSSGLSQFRLILVIHLGYSDLNCFGCVISTVCQVSHRLRFFRKNANLCVDGHVWVLEWGEHNVNR